MRTSWRTWSEVIDSASDITGMQRIARRRWDEMSKLPGFRSPDGQMVPPWLEFPDYERACMGWRMGGGQDYIRAFCDFYASLNEEGRASYSQR